MSIAASRKSLCTTTRVPFQKKLHLASLKIRLPLKNKQHRKMFRRRWTVKEKLRLIRETEGSSYNLHQIWLAEDVLSILLPNQVQREVWVKSNLPLVSHADHVAGTAATIRPITSNITTSPTGNIDGNNGNNYACLPQTAIFLDNPTHIPSIISHVIDVLLTLVLATKRTTQWPLQQRSQTLTMPILPNFLCV